MAQSHLKLTLEPEWIRVTNSSFVGMIGYDLSRTFFMIQVFHTPKHSSVEKVDIFGCHLPPCMWNIAKQIVATNGSIGTFFTNEIKPYFRLMKFNALIFGDKR